MTGAREVEAARWRFLRGGASAVGDGAVRAVVLASWERSRAHAVDTERLGASFVGHGGPPATPLEAAGAVLDEAHADNPEFAGSLLLVDADGLVRVRRDGDPALSDLLDAVRLVPGYRHAEAAVGTTAATLALHEGTALAVEGPEHFHPQLSSLAAAAAPVGQGRPDLALVVVRHAADGAADHLPWARALARRVDDQGTRRRRARVLALHDALDAAGADGAPWAVATDGDVVLVSSGVRRVAPEDQQSLSDRALAALVIDEPPRPHHVDLPSGTCAEVAVHEIRADGVPVGCVLTGGPAEHDEAPAATEARRRQGSHVAPTARRDFAAPLRDDRSPAERAHAEARVRANRELLSPYLRARQEVVANLGHRRHQVLLGETGVGKRTLALEQFHRLHPDGAVTVVECAKIGDTPAATDPLAGLAQTSPSRPHLALLRGVQALGPVAARRLDESLRVLVARADPVVVVGCLDTASVDATRPYGLLLRHFHETVRVPALRYRADELGDIAQSVLRTMTTGRSLRLSHQVVRVLEGYPWPGNINELEDVLRYVVARKPVGVVQAPDLPSLCFTSRAPKLSMLETAQCDAIIQALYEARGNRYRAAAMLGIARSSLYRKIDAFGISYIA